MPKTAAPKKYSPKAERAKKDGLRGPQIRILQTLARNSRPLSRKQIAEKAGVDPTKIGDYAGPRPDSQSFETAEKWPFPDLHTAKLVRVEQHDIDGRDVLCYTITAAGRKALEASQNA